MPSTDPVLLDLAGRADFGVVALSAKGSNLILRLDLVSVGLPFLVGVAGTSGVEFLASVANPT